MINNEEILKRLKEDPVFRRALVRKSFHWFFHYYLFHYAFYPTAPFQKEIINILQNEDNQMVVIVAFRGSSKSTIATLAYVLWSIVGLPHKQYILLISQTQQLARQMLTNIRREWETNKDLIKDFGPFYEQSEEWRANSLIVSPYGTRITAVSPNEGSRGLRHRQFRPDLIIGDDMEDLESVKTKENRDKLWDWLTKEINPIGDINTKRIFIGNLLHEDSLMMRLKQKIQNKSTTGIYRQYALLDDNGNSMWPGKFPDKESIERLRLTVADESAWYLEYLLKIIADKDRVIPMEWIEYYDNWPDFYQLRPRRVCVGVDLAISQKESADKTAIVCGIVYGYGNSYKLYILPNIVNKRLTFPQTIDTIVEIYSNLFRQFKIPPVIYVENVAYQLAVVQELAKRNIQAEGVQVAGLDKRSRLNIPSGYLKDKKILFPRSESGRDLIDQIVNFGIEKYDDLTDAFTILAIKAIEGDMYIDDSPRPPKPPMPIYKDFGGERIDMSRPLTSGFLNARF